MGNATSRSRLALAERPSASGINDERFVMALRCCRGNDANLARVTFDILEALSGLLLA